MYMSKGQKRRYKEMEKETINEVITDLQNMDGRDLLDLSVAVLCRLRTIYHTDTETQTHINYILNKLYNIKF